MKSTYSEAFIEQALVKVFTRGSRSILSVTRELNVNYHTVKHWMRNRSAENIKLAVIPENRPQDWRAEEQLLALLETHALSGEALNAWCRERGLFVHHLTAWKAAFCVDGKSVAAGSREMRTLKDENDQLKRALSRKEKALAAAARLILQKNVPGALGGRGRMTSLVERSQVMALLGEAMAGGALGSGLRGDLPVRTHGATLAARCVAGRSTAAASAVTRQPA